MENGLPVSRYQFMAVFRDGVIDWSLAFETKGGERHTLSIRDGDDVPLLYQMLQGDKSVYYHGPSNSLRTGWNFPGGAGQ